MSICVRRFALFLPSSCCFFPLRPYLLSIIANSPRENSGSNSMATSGFYTTVPRSRDGVLQNASSVLPRQGRLVGGVLGNQFAAEGLGENGLVEMLDQLASASRFRCEAIDPNEGCLYAMNDFGSLFSIRPLWCDLQILWTARAQEIVYLCHRYSRRSNGNVGSFV